jgi:hypothetical protein
MPAPLPCLEPRPVPASRPSRLKALACILCLGAAGNSAAQALRLDEGVARIPGEDAVIYREKHWTRYENDLPVDRLVLYLCPDGTPFGRKSVDYRPSPIAPDFEFVDMRSGYREGLRRVAGVATAWYREARALERAASLGAAQLVADAGFDNFIRSRWAELIRGASLPLSFAVPARLRTLEFRLGKVGSTQVAGEAAHVFRLRLGGWLGLVAPHIDVAYGQRSRRLLRFEGLSNLRDDAGRRQLVARIDFPAQDQAASEAGRQAAATAPLRACSVRP